MDLRCCLAGLVPVALLLSLATPVRAETCQLKQLASFPIYDDPSGTVRVPVHLNGKKDTVLALDTGAFFSTLHENVVKELGLETKKTSLSLVAAGGGVLKQLVVADTLQLGNMVGKKAEFFVAGDSSSVDRDVNGLFGADFLSNYDVDLDFGQMKAGLFSQDHCEGKVVYWSPSYVEEDIHITRSHHVVVNVKIDGHKLRAMLDTGAGDSILQATNASHYFDRKIGDPGVTEHGFAVAADGNRLKRYETRFDTLEFAGITFRNPQIVIQPDVMPLDDADMILGMHQLRQLHLYIAYDEEKLYATPLDPADIAKRQADLQALLHCGGTAQGDETVTVEDRFKACSALLAAPNQLPSARVMAFINRGLGNAMKASFSDAIADYSAALAIDPQAVWAINDRGVALRQTGASDKALADFDYAIQIQPKIALPWYNRCLVQASKGALDKALGDCGQAVQLQPDNAVIEESMGFVNLRSGRLDEAIAAYDKALKASPDYPNALYGRSLAKGRKGDKDGAAADLAAAQKLKPDVAASYDRSH